jgi:hypothetical protein
MSFLSFQLDYRTAKDAERETFSSSLDSNGLPFLKNILLPQPTTTIIIKVMDKTRQDILLTTLSR